MIATSTTSVVGPLVVVAIPFPVTTSTSPLGRPVVMLEYVDFPLLGRLMFFDLFSTMVALALLSDGCIHSFT